ncbi:MAG: right-handed parallel beta-helix repeat-containing protein [Candidatus Coatesbacteria bacterium]|nr:right-handed parallel beta-helix repeat-containing protein [Candidatus Coatesbacteria bacterium]
MLIRRQFIFAGVLVLAMLLLTVAGALADLLKVPTAYPTIANALASCGSGDLISVGPGYTGTGESFPLLVNDYIRHKDVTLQGQGMGVTVLDAKGSSRVITIADAAGHTIDGFKIVGFTIKGGYVDSGSGSNSDTNVPKTNGGGIYCYKATNLLIKDCEITGNYAAGSFASRDGRGGYDWSCVTGSDGSKFPARAGGGGIYLRYSKDNADVTKPTVTIEQCLIHDNETGMGGGGICSNYGPADVRHCCLYNNKACQGGGVYWFDYILGDPPDNDPKIPHILFNDLIFGNIIRVPAYYGCAEGSGAYAWTDDQGGGVYMSSWGLKQKFRVYSTTVADNNGYEVYISHNCQNPDVEGANDIFWHDADDTDKKGFHDDGFQGTADFSYSDISWKNCGGNVVPYPGYNSPPTDNHNISSVPLFDCYGDGTVKSECYFLQRTSLAVDSGNLNATTYTPQIYTPNWFTTDKTGVRDGKDGNELDMGYHSMTYGASYVELISFAANPSTDEIVLNWETGTEIDNAGFVVYRAVAGAKDYVLISGLIAAQGDAASGASYAFVDEDVEPGVRYEYWLVDIDTSGQWAAHGPAFARLLVSLKPFQLPTANNQPLTAR